MQFGDDDDDVDAGGGDVVDDVDGITCVDYDVTEYGWHTMVWLVVVVLVIMCSVAMTIRTVIPTIMWVMLMIMMIVKLVMMIMGPMVRMIVVWMWMVTTINHITITTRIVNHTIIIIDIVIDINDGYDVVDCDGDGVHDDDDVGS